MNKMERKSAIYYIALGFLLLGVFLEEAEGRRAVLLGQRVITRQYLKGPGIPAWSISLLCGLGMLVIGGGAFVILKKLLVDDIEVDDVNSYQPAMTEDV